MKIERLSKNNFNHFFSLVKELAKYEELDPPDEAAKKRLEKDGLSKNPRFITYLGRINEEYVGYISFYPTYSSMLALPVLYLEDIYVQEKHRKKGIGQELFDFYLKKSNEMGCCRAEWFVLKWNKPARNFYEKNGAKELKWAMYRLTKEEISKRDS